MMIVRFEAVGVETIVSSYGSVPPHPVPSAP